MDLSDSLGRVNLSDILDKTLEGTSEMLQLLEEEETTAITSTTVPSSTDNTFLLRNSNGSKHQPQPHCHPSG